MKTYMQMKDGIAFAHIATSGDFPDGIEVDATIADSLLNKKYVNGSWIDAEKITYVTLNNNRDAVIEVNKTFYPSDVKDDQVISNNADVLVGWNYDGSNFSAPEIIQPVPVEVINEVIREVFVYPELPDAPE